MPRGSEIETTAAAPVAAPAAPATGAPKKAAPAAGAPKTTPAAPAPATPAAGAAIPQPRPRRISDVTAVDIAEEAQRLVAAQRAEAQQRKEALEAVGRIRDLQRSGQIGEVQMSTAPGETRRPSMQPLTVRAGERPTPGGSVLSSRPDRVVAPTVAPRVIDTERTAPAALADQAIGAGRLFTAAISMYNKGGADLDAKIQSGAVAPIDYRKLAEAQQRRLQEVLNLAAQMREYGFVGSNEELIEQFAPK